MKNTKKKSNYQTKNVISSFTGKNITKYGGLSPIMRFIDKLKLGNRLNDLFSTDMYNATKFTKVQIILATILSSMSGIRHISKISNFTCDGLVQTLLGLKKRINVNAISHSFKQLGISGANKLQNFGLELTKDFIDKTALKVITIDCDSTVLTVYGSQEGAVKGYNPQKKGANSYHPLLAFNSETKVMLNSWFRTGSAYTANGICQFIQQTISILPKGASLFFRADSGFFNGDLFDTLEERCVNYLVKVKMKNLTKLLQKQEWTQLAENNDISICEFDYKGSGWKKTRKLKAVRMVVNRTRFSFFGKTMIAEEYEYVCFCSDLTVSATELYKKYSERSTSETWIEQVKSQLMAGKTLTDDFWANDIIWQLSVMAYNLSVMMRYRVEKLYKEEHTTFREWFIEVPAKIVRSGNQIFLKIYQNYYFKNKWLKFEQIIS